MRQNINRMDSSLIMIFIYTNKKGGKTPFWTKLRAVRQKRDLSFSSSLFAHCMIQHYLNDKDITYILMI